MVFRKGGFSIRPVALFAEFFCFLFVHGKEFFMNFIMRQLYSGLRGCCQQKDDDSCSHSQEDDVVKQGIPLFAAVALVSHLDLASSMK